MARSIRVQYEEGAYHVMARGNEREKYKYDVFGKPTITNGSGKVSDGVSHQ